MTWLAVLAGLFVPAASAAEHLSKPQFQLQAESFSAQEAARGLTSIAERLQFRIHEQPFLLIATILFVLAIVHTFLTVPITRLAHRIEHEHDAKLARDPGTHALPEAHRPVSFTATLLHFLGEVEAIFGIWAGVLLATLTGFHGLDAMKAYLANINFTEPLFVVVIMALASTRPVLSFAEGCLRLFARLGKESPAAWWLAILIVAPLLGSFITEPGAMTIAAMLLARKFYRLKPSPRFAYGTLGLLFVNISIGGVLTNFAAPPVLMVAKKWDLSSAHMFVHYGDKAIVAILLSTVAYFLIFRRELQALAAQVPDRDGDGVADWSQHRNPVPWFVSAIHLLFMAFTVFFAHDPALFIGGFLVFLAFSKATRHHQNPVSLRSDSRRFLPRRSGRPRRTPGLVAATDPRQPRRMAAVRRRCHAHLVQRQRRHHLPCQPGRRPFARLEIRRARRRGHRRRPDRHRQRAEPGRPDSARPLLRRRRLAAAALLRRPASHPGRRRLLHADAGQGRAPERRLTAFAEN